MLGLLDSWDCWLAGLAGCRPHSICVFVRFVARWLAGWLTGWLALLAVWLSGLWLGWLSPWLGFHFS
jgi:hypothetical protein